MEAATKGTVASLGPRLITGVVLAICAVAAVGVGGLAFLTVVGVLTAVVAFEWIRMSCRARSNGSLILSVVAVTASAASFAGWGAVGALLVGAAGVALVGAASRMERNKPILTMSGLALFLLSLISICWLRQENSVGMATVYWLFAVVWATDSGAYFLGSLIGGAKIATRISPKKTWSGAIGGLVFGILIGVVSAVILESAGVLKASTHLVTVSIAGAIVSLLAQTGDFAESAVKRHFAVKDSGSWLPGHGGALDRLDSLIFVSPFLALAVWLAGGSTALLWGGG